MKFQESDIQKIWETLVEVDDMDLGTTEKIEIIKDFLKFEMKYDFEDILRLDDALQNPETFAGREPAS